MQDKASKRLARQIEKISRLLPFFRKPAKVLIRRGWMVVRLPLAIALIVGGLFSFLPILGLWMLPLGLLFLAVDVPFLRGPTSRIAICFRRWSRMRLRSLKHAQRAFAERRGRR